MTLPLQSLPQTRPFRFVPFCEIEGLLAWTPREVAEFRHTEARLCLANLLSAVKFGESEDGHPWCVFLLNGSAVESAYVCFQDGRYVADWQGMPGAIETTDLRVALDRLLAAALDRGNS